MTSSRPGADVVARALSERIDELVRWLGLAPLDKAGNMWTPLNPMRGDRHPGSFVIYGRGHAKAGGWVDYVEPDRLKGDALDLCAYIRTGNPRDRRTGYAAACEFLGWEGARALDLPAQEKQRLALERDRELAEKADAEALAAERRQAFERWAHRDRRIEVDGVVWRYLASRGIDLHKFIADRRRPNALKQRDDDFHRESKRKLVSMTALISGPDGKPWSVHRTFLKADGSGKADVEPARKIWPGKFWGGAIRLAKGVNDCSPEEAARQGLCGEVLAIGEGVETMLSVALACPAWRAWAAGNVGAIGRVVVPASVSMVILVGENDESAEARRAFETAMREQAAQAKRQGYELYVTRPPAGVDDFNTALQRLGERFA
ncbi:MAG: hypothetical protein BroJett013_30330 [Alphaproteobacteria bacterium]|nr:MAG: hypothetical protein BroJett013_30330 [Alphaproteobacteria bacterium]